MSDQQPGMSEAFRAFMHEASGQGVTQALSAAIATYDAG